MTSFKLIGAALMLSTFATPVLAQVPQPGDYSSGLGDEPAAFQSQYPNRDVLNRGQLTIAGRAMTIQPGFGGLRPSKRRPRAPTSAY
jgi:hypothetical protein